MRNGCVLSVKGICQKYNVECDGYLSEKKACPMWGFTMAAEKYFSDKGEFEEKFEYDKYYKRL